MTRRELEREAEQVSRLDGIDSIHWTLIPPLMQGALERYLGPDRILPGDCLRAILANDLSGAIGRADPETTVALGHIVKWLYNYAPSRCWGSAEKMMAWVQDEEIAA
jgi:hypothetical protein